MANFNVLDCYWIVGADAAHVWSSARQIAVATSDSTYAQWLTAGNLPRPIPSYSDLYGVLLSRVPMIAAAVAPTWITNDYLSPDQALGFFLSQGIMITSTGTPALNGVYDISPDSQLKISGVVTGVTAGKGIPGGASTFAWQDMGGVPHEFTSTQFIDFAAAIEEYMYSLYMTEGVLLNGGSVDWPDSTVTIP